MVNDSAKAFGAWLKSRRIGKGLKMPQLAVLVGTNKQTISRWEKASPQTLTNKPSLPKRELVIALAKALNADENQILKIAGYASDNPPNGFYHKYESLPDNKKKLAERQINAILDSLADVDENDVDYI